MLLFCSWWLRDRGLGSRGEHPWRDWNTGVRDAEASKRPIAGDVYNRLVRLV